MNTEEPQPIEDISLQLKFQNLPYHNLEPAIPNKDELENLRFEKLKKIPENSESRYSN